jgi:putative ABC transport system ATP-binding protein
VTLRVNELSLILGDGDQEITALNNVSLNIDAGEFTALLGPSGSGKSSLLAVCGGLRSPSSGDVFLGETKLSALPEKDRTKLRRQKIGFVFQQSNLLPSLTAIDQLLLTVHINGRQPNQQDREKARSLLANLGLEKRLNRRPGQLSGGEKQRIGIARALMTGPDLLLLDEPTSSLDHQRGTAITELISELCHKHSVATLMVTHDKSMASYADKLLRIEDGKVSSQ